MMVVSVRLLRKQKGVDADFRVSDENGYIWVQDTNEFSPTYGKPRPEHLVIAERTLGKPLRRGVEVHHVDCNPANNANSNLVICPDRKYHALLHKRIRARRDFGNPNRVRCYVCGKGGLPHDMFVHKSGYKHDYCASTPKKKAKPKPVVKPPILDPKTEALYNRVLAERKAQERAAGIVDKED